MPKILSTPPGVILGLMLAGALTVGCEQATSASGSGKNPETPPHASKPDKAERPNSLPENAVASINEELISKQEFDLVVNQYESMDPEGFSKLTDSERQSLFGSIMDKLVTLKVQLQEAQKHDIRVPAELIEQEYQAFKGGFSSEEEFLETLRKGKTTPLIWKKGVKEYYMIQRLHEKMAEQLPISPDEIQRFWEEQKENLKKDMIRARQILVKTEKEADRVLSRLNEGASFERLVEEYSVDFMTKNKGGDLGWIIKGNSIPEFEQKVFPLNPEQVSPPIKGKYGYHIVQVLDKKKGTETTLEDYRERIEFILRNQKWQSKKFGWIESLKKNAVIEITDGMTLSQAPVQTVLDQKLPQIGEKAILSRNKKLAPGVKKADLCSAETYCDMHDQTIHEAVAQKKPLLILFATPGFCETGTCSPQLHDVLKMKKRYGDRVNFIHVDIYLDMDTVVEWGIETEPWTIIVDREGKIRGRLGGMTGGKAIEREILKVLS